MNKSKLVNVFGLILFSCLCLFATSCSGGSSSNGGGDSQNNGGDDSKDCPIDQPRCQSRKDNSIGS